MNALETPRVAGGLDERRARDFLFLEARLADEHRFDEWMQLWDDAEVLYWVPCNRDDPDPGRHISIAYDDRSRLEDRIFRLQSRAMHAQRPRSRMRRLLTNIETMMDDGRLAEVEANFMLAEVRSGRQDVFAGRITYRLRYDGERVRMVGKKVVLLNNDEFIDNLTFLL